MRDKVMILVTIVIGLVLVGVNRPTSELDDIIFPSGIHGHCYWSDTTPAGSVRIICRDTANVIYTGNSENRSPIDWYLASKDYPTNRSADFYIPYNNRYYVKGIKRVPGGTWYSDWYGPIDYNSSHGYPEQDIFLIHFDPDK